MSDDARLQFSPARGSVVGGYSADKRGRLAEAVQDLELTVTGLAMQFGEEGSAEGEAWTKGVAALARACSMFLRKTALGDFGKRETRLLDDAVLEAIGLRFHRLVQIPQAQRRTLRMGLGIEGGELHITKLNDDTGEPEWTQITPAGPQRLEIVVEWPLPGAAGWTGAPTKQAPWQVAPEMLFRLDREPDMDCDAWLGQQVVRFDDRGISLKEIIQTVVNFEAAHSISTSRLATVGDEEPAGARRKPQPHILNALTFCGVRYAHLVVIESALYLLDALIGNEAVTRAPGDLYRVQLAVACDADEAESETPTWVSFRGTMMMAFNNAPAVIRHEIRPVGRG